MTDSGIHVDPEALVRLEARKLEAEEKSRVLSHLETCGRCQAELALLRGYRSVPADARLAGGHSDRLEASFRQKLQDRAQSDAKHLSAHRRPGLRVGTLHLTTGRDWMVAGLVAASLTLLATGGYEMLQSTPTGELGVGFRSAAEHSPRLELRVEATATGWAVRWSPRDDIESYHVQVLTARGETVLERDVDESRIHIERSELAVTDLAQLLLVRIEATDAQGLVVRSEPARLVQTGGG